MAGSARRIPCNMHASRGKRQMVEQHMTRVMHDDLLEASQRG
jgi:hypothetical protein